MARTAEQKAQEKQEKEWAALKKERKKKAKKGAMKAATAYVRMEKSIKNDRLSNEGQKNEQRYQILSLHSPEIEELLDAYGTERRLQPGLDFGDRDIKKLVEGYFKYYLNRDNVAGSSGPDLLAGIQEKANAAGKQEGIDSDENMDKTVRSDQLVGLENIAKWMYRNHNDTGALCLSNSMERFVRMILQLPARARLLIFFLVEKKRRHNPNLVDVMESQTSYVPNLEAFKDQMISTKWKFWKRVDGSYVYWEKLEQALSVTRTVMDQLSLYGDPGEPASLERNADPSASGNPTAAAAPDPQAEARRLQRESMMKTFREAAIRHNNLLRNKEEGKAVKEGDLIESQGAVSRAYINLAEVDKQFDRVIEGPQEDFEESSEDKAQNYVGMAETAMGQGSNVEKLPDAAEFVRWNLADPHLVNINLASSTFTTLGAFASFVSTIISIYSLFKSAGGLSTQEKVEQSLSIISNFAGIAESLTGAAYGYKNAKIVGDFAETAFGKAAKANADKASGAAAIVTGAITMGIGMHKADQAAANRAQLQEASAALLAKNDLTAEERAQLEEINALGTRIHDSKESSGALQMAAGYMQMMGGIFTATGVGAVVGTIFSAIGTAISLANSVKEFFERRKNIEATIDGYIKMDAIWAYVKSKLPPAEASKEDKYRDQIRAESIAVLGFASNESFYRHITRTYAQFLFDRAFYDKDGHVIVAAASGDSHKNEYARILESFGIKLKYPKDSNGLPGPDIDTIAQKMKI